MELRQRCFIVGGNLCRAMAIAADDNVVSAAKVTALKKLIAELERVLGKKTMENEVPKAAVELARKKTDLAHALVRDRGFSK